MANLLDDKIMSSAGYTNLNGTYEDDLWNTKGAARGNGTTSRFHKTQVFSAGVPNFSIFFGILMNGNPASFAHIISQLNSGGTQGIFLCIDSSGNWVFDCRTSLADRTASNTSVTITDGVYHRIGLVVDAGTPATPDGTIKIYKNKVEVTYGTLNSDHASGDGWQSPTAGMVAEQWSLLGAEHFSRPVPGDISRIRIENTAFNQAAVNADFDAWEAAKGEGLGASGGIIQPIISPIVSRVIPSII